MSKKDKIISDAVKICTEYDITPDDLALMLLRQGEDLGRGKIWGRKPARDKAYRKFLTSYPCALSLREDGIEAAHISEMRYYHISEKGMAQKVSDYSCVPIHHILHRAIHDGRMKLNNKHLLACALARGDILAAYIERSKC